MMWNKIRHFYFNKYIVKPLSGKRYFISYDFCHKALWFRVYKVATRTIDHELKSNCKPGDYIYSSDVGYNHLMYKDFFKFAFVRDPESRFVSAWKDKVLKQNYFNFSKSEHQSMKNLDNFIKWVNKLDIKNCDEHLREQSSLIDINNIDFIGRFESFESDFNYVTEQIGLGHFESVHLNRSSLNNYSISNKNKEEIAMIYNRDIRIFYPEKIEALSGFKKP